MRGPPPPRGALAGPGPKQPLTLWLLQGDLGPFNPGLPVEVPLWLAINLKQRQKCRLIPPAWMDVGKETARSELGAGPWGRPATLLPLL